MEKKPEGHRFTLSDEWSSYLTENGYVVIQVANPDQVQTAINLFWEVIEATTNARRNDLATWKNWPLDERGISLDARIMQSRAAWFVRSLPNVISVFSQIWSTDNLLVSMDSPLIWKPWWHHAKWKPKTEGLHLDQNLWTKPNKECVQGMVCLYDVTEETGGLQVVPKSHLESEQFRSRSLPMSDDFMIIPEDDPWQERAKFIQAKAGDLILWDSRTCHGGVVGSGKKPQGDVPQLARLSLTVCMTPREKADKKVLETRKQGFENGFGFSHWPHEAEITARARKGYVPIVLTPEQAKLL